MQPAASSSFGVSAMLVDGGVSSGRSSCDLAGAASGGMVLHRCRLGGPPEIETVYFGSATALGPETTVARWLPIAASLPLPDGDDNGSIASSGAAPPSPRSSRMSCDGLPPRASCDSMRASCDERAERRGRAGASRRSSASSFGSAAWLASLASEQALLDSHSLWVGADRAEHAVRGGQRKGAGAGLARPSSYPANLAGAAAAAARSTAPGPAPQLQLQLQLQLQPHLQLRGGLVAGTRQGPGGGRAAAASGLRALPQQCPERGVRLRHASSAPSTAVQFALASATSDGSGAAVAACCSSSQGGLAGSGDSAAGLVAAASSDGSAEGAPLIHLLSLDSRPSDAGAAAAAAAAAADEADSAGIGAVHGGESAAQSMERCMRGGRRRSSSQLLRSSSLEALLLTRSASNRSFHFASPSSPHAAPRQAPPMRSQSVRCIATSGGGALGGGGGGGSMRRLELASARSMPCGVLPSAASLASPPYDSAGSLAASCSQLELLQSPQDSLLGLSIVRVRLGCAGDAPLAHAASAPPGPNASGAPRPGAARAPAPGCSWQPSAALAAAAASAAAASGAGCGAPAARSVSTPQLRLSDGAAGRHQGIDGLIARRAELEEALGSGWASAEPLGLPLVAEEPHS
ncbi:hypothetical protein Rsub_11864 [Raphidocelis subcapitata]|uniref:Uncharacterized protein n=1 Tax=Raphidocelis subcapitata TaxID=307507 RepID=A0A2V0PFC1_9CHLO|nr:hypothetical protein Rsub_11864 [Raphidocelis subcapitata]|eukprot:GBF98534.1 hypothetical protein Rsub_11864 [Raphidocelis subcapitata]